MAQTTPSWSDMKAHSQPFRRLKTCLRARILEERLTRCATHTRKDAPLSVDAETDRPILSMQPVNRRLEFVLSSEVLQR